LVNIRGEQNINKMIKDYFEKQELYEILDFVCEDDINDLWEGRLDWSVDELEILGKLVGVNIDQLVT